MANLGRNLLFALIGIAFMLPVASAGLVQIYLDDSEDLVTAEKNIKIQYGKDFILTFHVGGDYRMDSGNENLSVYSIHLDVIFLSDTDRRATCAMCAIPTYQSLSDTEPDPGYDEYLARFELDSDVFKGYSGNTQFSIIMENRTEVIVWDNVLDITIGTASESDDNSSGFSIPELPPVIQDNLMEIGIGLLVVIILSVGIYTFILAPEDMTADLYKVKESIDPLSKSLTGVGYDSDLPGKEDEDDDTEDLLDDDEEEFDESKLLAELTGTGSQKLKSTDDEEKEEPEPPKKAVKKKVVKRSVSKKVVRKAAPPQDAPKRSPVNMGEGIISITCPSCEKVHNVDEDTVKFICGCGRRIRMN